MFTLGRQHFLYVTDLKLVKEIAYLSHGIWESLLIFRKIGGPLLGKGPISTNGAVWSHQRKTIGPQVDVEKVKVKLFSNT